MKTRPLFRFHLPFDGWVVVALGLIVLTAPLASAALVSEAWVRRYNLSWDRAVAVAADANGQVVVTGHSSVGNYFTADFYTVKYSAAGSMMWERRYNSAANSHDSPVALALDAAGNVVVTGTSYTSANNPDYYTAKYAAATGALLWERRYNGPTNDYDISTFVAVDLNGDVLVTGQSWNGRNDDFYTAKYTAVTGAILWEQRYNSPSGFDEAAPLLAVDFQGNVIVTGRTYNVNATDASDFITLKYSGTNGALLWERRFNGALNGDDWPSGLAVAANGDVIVAGRTSDQVGAHKFDYCTVRYAAATGALLWQKTYNGAPSGYNSDAISDVAVDPAGDIVVTGSSTSAANGSEDIVTIKYAGANGAELWTRRFDGQAGRHDRPSDLRIDPRGNVLVAGVSSITITNSAYYTAKYEGSNGTLLWEMFYSGPARSSDGATSLAVGPGGTVVVTGNSDSVSGFGDSFDYATIMYVESPTIALRPGGVGFDLTFSATPGQTSAVQRATALPASWTTVATLVAPAGGFINWTDTNPPPGKAFYRLSPP